MSTEFRRIRSRDPVALLQDEIDRLQGKGVGPN